MNAATARQASNSRCEDFQKYCREQQIEKESVASQLMVNIGRQMKLQYAPSTRRTHFGHLVREKRMCESVKAKELGKQLRETGVSKAPPIGKLDLGKVVNSIGASGTEALMLEVLVSTCCRVTSLGVMTHMRWDGKEWTFLLGQHKTRSKGVMGDMKINGENFSSSLIALLSRLKTGDSLFGAKAVTSLKTKLSREGYRLHSFRRGGGEQILTVK
jgi:hypothetical protein